MKSALFIGGSAMMALVLALVKRIILVPHPFGTQTHTYNNIRFDEAD